MLFLEAPTGTQSNFPNTRDSSCTNGISTSSLRVAINRCVLCPIDIYAHTSVANILGHVLLGKWVINAARSLIDS